MYCVFWSSLNVLCIQMVYFGVLWSAVDMFAVVDAISIVKMRACILVHQSNSYTDYIGHNSQNEANYTSLFIPLQNVNYPSLLNHF